MKKQYFFFFAICCLVYSRQLFAQGVMPEVQWSYSYPVPENTTHFCDDFPEPTAFTAAYGSASENGLVSLDDAGNLNFLHTEPGAVSLEYGPMLNIGDETYVVATDNELHQIRLNFYVNTSGAIASSFIIPIPANYTQSETISSSFRSDATHQYITLMIKTFDTTDSKWKTLIARIVVDTLGDTATHEFTSIMVGTYATTPVDMVIDGVGNVYIWGYFNKNAGGTNHDNFLSKYNAAGIFQYTKTFASYAGRDDLATEIVIDQLGNIYGISQSDANVAPYIDQIAVFKIKGLNGKMIWLKRLGGIGEGASDYNQCWDAAGNPFGEGLALTGSIPNASGGRDSKIWRLNGAGTVLWNKTINIDLSAASIEEGRAISFNAVSGDVMVAGFVFHTIYFGHYNTTTGVAAYPASVYAGIESGLVLNEEMILTSSLTGEDLLLFPSENTGGTCCRASIVSYHEIAMKENELQTEDEIVLFPNPAVDEIHVSGLSEEDMVFIYTMHGELVQTAGDSGNTIQINNLKPCAYLMQIISGDEINTRSFIKSF